MAESTPIRDRHHKPAVSWPLRVYREGDWPRIYVQTAPGSRVEVDLFEAGERVVLSLTRQQARMLARRINECLEFTK